MFVSAAFAQVPDSQPYIAGFKPTLDVYPQNFSIAADNDGNVYLGNSDGVVVYDGDRWHIAPTNGDLVRSLAFDGNDRVYVGGFNAFGYVEKNQLGEFEFTDLTPLYREEIGGDLFADIWTIVVSPQGVFFIGLEHLFRFDPASGSNSGFWKHTGSLGPSTVHEGKVWLQWRGEGIKSFDGDSWQLHAHPGLDRDYLAALIPVDDELLIVNLEADWLRYGQGVFEPVIESQSIPHRASITGAFDAGSNVIGLTTQLGLVVFHDFGSGQSDVVRVSNGFLPEAVRSPDGSLLVVDDQGFRALQWPARWQSVGPAAGLAGRVHSIHLKGDSLYALTSSGAFVVDVNQDRFRRLPWTDYEAWDMLFVDGGILFADSYEIKLVSPVGDIVTLDNSTTARRFFPSPGRDDLVYAATEFGLQLLLKTSEGWTVQTTLDDMTNLTVRQIIETSPGELLIGSDRGGIHKVSVNPVDWSLETRQLTEDDGITYGDLGVGAYVYRLEGELFASTGAGLFRFNGESFERDSLDGLDLFLRPDEAIELAELNGSRWAFNSSRVFRWQDGWQEEDISLISVGANTTMTTHEQQVLVGNLGSILIYDPTAAVAERKASPLKLTGVSLDTANTEEAVQLPLTDIRISTADERLTLSYAMPDYRNPGTVRYRTRLMPIESRFSGWAAASQLSLVDLQAGRYTLMIEAKNSVGQRSSLQVPLQVEAQWYETGTARLLAVALSLLLFYGVFRIFADRRSRLLARENALLEEKVKERTRALETANRQLDRMAHIDGLTQIPNRRKLDDHLRDVFDQAREREREMAVALIDVDFFKRYNDTHGHQAGDALLVDLARLLTRNLRRSEDLVARYGGEEFLVVMPGADRETAFRVIDDMRRKVEESELGVTVSAGVHSLTPSSDASVEAMIESADQALYQAKASGRNRVLSG